MKNLHVINPLEAVANVRCGNGVACHLHDHFAKFVGANVGTENLTNGRPWANGSGNITRRTCTDAMLH
jgi:hypothetical protein